MKTHFSSTEEARAAVEPVLRAWEVDAHLRSRRRGCWCRFGLWELFFPINVRFIRSRERAKERESNFSGLLDRLLARWLGKRS